MNLYVYDHCPFCLRVRVAMAQKKIDYKKIYLLNDDEDNPLRMIGKKLVPILEYEPHNFMGESMDIIEYLDENFGPEPEFLWECNYGNTNEINGIVKKMYSPILKLCFPRWIQIGLPEFRTEEAVNYFKSKKERSHGDFSSLLANTDELIAELNPNLQQLTEVFNYDLRNFNLDDIEVFSWLRGLSCVKKLSLPPKLDIFLKEVAERSDTVLYYNKAI